MLYEKFKWVWMGYESDYVKTTCSRLKKNGFKDTLTIGLNLVNVMISRKCSKRFYGTVKN